MEYLTYNKEDNDAKQNCLKNISLDELKLIYSKIYDTEIKGKVTVQLIKVKKGSEKKQGTDAR